MDRTMRVIRYEVDAVIRSTTKKQAHMPQSCLIISSSSESAPDAPQRPCCAGSSDIPKAGCQVPRCPNAYVQGLCYCWITGSLCAKFENFRTKKYFLGIFWTNDVDVPYAVDGEPVTLPAGVYTVEVLTEPVRTRENVIVAGEADVVLQLED